jgi:adenine-specific DNA-methyltransferase
VIVHAAKERARPVQVTTTSSASASAENDCLVRYVPYAEVIHPDDPEQFIRVVPDGISQQIVNRMARFNTTLTDLGFNVSTGRVVDFRATDCIMADAGSESAPLIYPMNIEKGRVVWPKRGKKMQYICICKETEDQLVANGNYVLVKRFSSKEQNRRVVSAVFEGNVLPERCVGFENHLNYFHQAGKSLDLDAAKGLSVYLNSTLVDAFFRQFNGHTQVNAGDLRSLNYPTLAELVRLGDKVRDNYPTQAEIDDLIEAEFFNMADTSAGDPITAQQRIKEALDVLSQLGLPGQQLNERSALALLALLDLAPERTWADASQPLLGITPISAGRPFTSSSTLA